MSNVPNGFSPKKYIETLLKRFSNGAVSDQLDRLCYHGGAKIPEFIIPTVEFMLGLKKDIKRVAFLFAAYAQYLVSQFDELGNAYKVDAPKLTASDWKIRDNNMIAFLYISPFKSAKLYQEAEFVRNYISIRLSIR